MPKRKVKQIPRNPYRKIARAMKRQLPICDCGERAVIRGRCGDCYRMAYKLGEIPTIQELRFLKENAGYIGYYIPPKDV